MTRPATAADVDEICAALPDTELGTSWGDVHTWLVPTRVQSAKSDRSDKGRGFVLYRKPHKSAMDTETGLPYDDLVVIRTADADDKQALVEGKGPFFTIDHFRNYSAVLVRQSRLGEITCDELAEVITDAWLATAPARLVAELDR